MSIYKVENLVERSEWEAAARAAEANPSNEEGSILNHILNVAVIAVVQDAQVQRQAKEFLSKFLPF